MRYVIIVVLCMFFVTPVVGQTSNNIYITKNHRFLFEIPEGWQATENEGSILILPVGLQTREEIEQHEIFHLILMDDSPNFSDASDIFNYDQANYDYLSTDDFEDVMFGDYAGAYTEFDDIIYATAIFEEGVVGHLSVFPNNRDLDTLRGLIHEILPTVVYLPPVLPFQPFELTETYVEEGYFSLQYPAGWSLSTNSEFRLNLRSNEERLALDITITTTEGSSPITQAVLSERINIITEALFDETDIEMSTFSMNGQMAVQSEADDLIPGKIMTLGLKDVLYVVIIGVTFEEYSHDAISNAMKVIYSTIQIPPASNNADPILDKEYVSADFGFQFSYPSEWGVSVEDESIVVFSDLRFRDSDDFLLASYSSMNCTIDLIKEAQILSAYISFDTYDPVEVQLHGKPAVRFDSDIGQFADTGETFILVKISDQKCVLMRSVFPKGERHNKIDLIYLMASTISLLE